ncbi:uncharacterized protein LOC129737895 [Uranotaenia lowii]|uniref:uncharacterized protein LOC129737895 n=1 Tax=Uranotaenia lowii TaxID=190385 RepID=UPI0024793D5C|nr:uncharacterized protein LOC129737895 [Uranotaenia lowii]
MGTSGVNFTISTGLTTPGRNESGFRESPEPIDSVALIPATVSSRPGPEIDCGDGVLQPASAGKYTVPISFPLGDGILPSSEQLPSMPSGRRDYISIFYQNVGGINSCVNEYLLASSCCCHDVIALTETWLNARTFTSQVFSSDYVVFRCDRGPSNSLKSTGGGVLLAIKSTLQAVSIDDNSWDDLEIVWVRLDLGNRKLFVCVVYIPPDRTRDVSIADSFSSCLTKVTSLASPEDDILIIGDFNLPGIKWCPSQGGFLYPDPARSSFSAFSETIFDSLSTATLRQINSVENENGRMLDLCFVNEGIRTPTIELAPVPLVKLVRYHPALLISIEVSGLDISSRKPAAFFLDYKNADFQAISEVLDSVDWESELTLSDPNAAAETFSHVINYIIDRHVPKRLVNENSRAPWITKELRQMKTLKCKAFRYYNRHKTQDAKDHYRKLNAAYKKASCRCYRNYLTRLQRNFKNSPKSFWKHVKDQRREFGLPTNMFLEGETASSDLGICPLLPVWYNRGADVDVERAKRAPSFMLRLMLDAD